jgi:DNA-binding NtrC family response regulator
MASEAHVMIVDDEAAIRRILARELQSSGFEVTSAADADEARKMLHEAVPDVILLDVRMPGITGDVFLRELREKAEEVPVIILTGHANVELAVQCMKDGASDLITKPCSIEHLEISIRRAIERRTLGDAKRTLLKAVGGEHIAPRMIGSSPKMQHLRQLVGRISVTDEPILIIGESGTGKELIAKAIQESSARARKPFITVNCAAVTETLLESELFGHEKGAFSGATERRLGFFELAHEGTIFLDEIGDMPLTMQPKLLRVLQSGEFRRVGGSKTLTADVRVIAATNKSLRDEVTAGHFREDLMHRINTFVLEAPALRDRMEDLSELIEWFLKDVDGGSPRHHFLPETLEAMRRYDWPGNVRELRNIVRRSAILTPEGPVTPDDLPGYLREHRPPASDPQSTLELTLEEVERRHIIAVLEDCGGNKTQAAKRLGVSVKTLYNKFEAWGLTTLDA